MTTHLRITYPPLAEGADPYTTQGCKQTGGEASDDPAVVDCERCLDTLLHQSIDTWRTQLSADVAAQLSGGEVSEDGYDMWHERAGEVCLATHHERISALAKLADGTHERVEAEVDFYCKLTPVHEHYTNHGWQVKVCYRHVSMGGYAHIDTWMPMDTDPHLLAQIVAATRRSAVKAIEHGMSFGAAALSAQGQAAA